MKEKKFLIPHCNECNEMFFYPRVVCPHCGGTNIEFQDHNGKGEIYSYSIVEKSFIQGFEKEVPYTVALVQLEGGKARMMTNIIECEPEKVEIGMPVEIHFQDVTDEIALPHFKPMKGGR
ncbi:Zn-ribbon domain-containing OB-fold protein [Planococcus salinus]|uniref:Zn-ribbon domain-containing OB-fold protein n=1 Tax=Planococcus salinus TaxID=1848460 RepID=UPI0013149BAC|nr:OB-fold domain-containing protein [Planococcus salinus]